MTRENGAYNPRMPLRILYDGWPLAYAPLSAAAWHLRTLLSLADPEAKPIIAMPVEPQTIPEGLELASLHTHDRGEWEQRGLQKLAKERGAAAIHTTAEAASLFGGVPTLVSPAESGRAGRSRLAEAQGRGGLARATILWSEDLPKPKLPGRLRMLAPVVHPEFGATSSVVNKLNLPDEFILVDGLPDEPSAVQLLESWTWAAASIGEFYPLVIVGLDEVLRNFVQARLPEFHVEGSVRLPDLIPQDLPGAYAACSALAHLGAPVAWGDPLRRALACGKAIVGQREPNTEAIVGAAGYLIEPGDLRGFGAALITVVVDEKAREKLEDATRERASRWSQKKYQEELLKTYQEFL
jgi:glycosyltransferase involved in cell wall biosynthesis